MAFTYQCSLGVGGLVSHGCIRLYPEDIKLLYSQVKVGTKLEIMYEPIKIGQRMAVYTLNPPDIYLRLPIISSMHGEAQAAAAYG